MIFSMFYNNATSPFAALISKYKFNKIVLCLTEKQNMLYFRAFLPYKLFFRRTSAFSSTTYLKMDIGRTDDYLRAD